MKLVAKRILTVGIGILAIGWTAGSACADVTVKGSDTMVILGQKWAEEFMKANPGAKIQVTGGGSGTGIAALINGTTDIAESSRPMKEAEMKQAADKQGKKVVERAVALDGVTVYINEANPIAELSMPQVRKIYTGQATNWKEFGGKDAPIVLYGRENNSGTYVFFKEHVLQNDDYASEMQTLPGTASVVNAVSKDPNGIGYGGIAYAQGLKHVKIKKDDQAPAVEASLENVQSGKYGLSRELFFYTFEGADKNVADFIAWVTGPNGQKIVTEVGYFPIK